MRFLIFFLLLLGCTPECMVISDASEIQFWKTGVDTSFNLEQEGYTDDYCFHQKFLCTGERKFQGYDADGVVRDYFLVGFDEDGEVVYNEQYDVYQERPAIPANIFQDYPFENWENQTPGIGPFWSIDSTPSVNLSLVLGQTSRPIKSQIVMIAGTFDIDFIVSNDDPIDLLITFYKNNVSVGSANTPVSPGSDQPVSLSITLTDTADEVRIIVSTEITSGTTVTFDATPETDIDPVEATPVIYSKELIPSDEGMCDKKITFKIFDGPDPETDTELFYTDAIDFVSVWTNSPGSGRVDIQYRSIQNFADLIYNSESPYFQIQLEGRFRKERKVTQEKTIELTEMVLNTAASVKIQRKLTIDDVPDYMHTKINLILAHAASGSVLINGKEWSKEESYDEGERPETYPLTPSEVWLTQKNYIKHNVI